MPYMEQIDTVRVDGEVNEVEEFESAKNGPSLTVRILGKDGNMFRLSYSQAELLEAGYLPEQVKRGVRCQVVAERVSPPNREPFLSVKAVQWHIPTMAKNGAAPTAAGRR